MKNTAKHRIFKVANIGQARAQQPGMILLITPSPRAEECLAAIREATGEPAECAQSLRRAAKVLRAGEYSALVIDQYLVECEPDAAEALLQHAGTAVPVCVNLAVSGTERVVRELKQAFRRAQRERDAAHREAESRLRNELNDSVTAMLLSCELALAVPHLPAAAESKIRSACELANDIRSRLGGGSATRVARSNGATRA